jgi:hypothetical protein
VLTAHSLGGLFAHLYARTYPDEVRGIVFVDAISATLPEVFGAKWPPYREVLQAAPPGASREEINRLYESAETALVRLQPNTPQIVATGSDHYVQWHEPDLVTDATRLVIHRVAR